VENASRNNTSHENEGISNAPHENEGISNAPHENEGIFNVLSAPAISSMQHLSAAHRIDSAEHDPHALKNAPLDPLQDVPGIHPVSCPVHRQLPEEVPVHLLDHPGCGGQHSVVRPFVVPHFEQCLALQTELLLAAREIHVPGKGEGRGSVKKGRWEYVA
jgi:hypothetical protein